MIVMASKNIARNRRVAGLRSTAASCRFLQISKVISDMPDDTNKPDSDLDPRVYFAAERTLLAWVRTGLAMMGFGFVVARFGLFLQELATASAVAQPPSTGISLWAGTTLLLLGVAICVGAAVKHWRTVRRLEQGHPVGFKPWSLGMVVAFVLGLFGVLLAIYLIFGLGRAA
jgi:putative membrane protein